MPEPSPSRRRLRQFSLRGLLVVLGLVAVAFGIWSNASAQREWRALHKFDNGLQISLTRRNSLGSMESMQDVAVWARAPAPWALWRADTVQSLFVHSVKPRMSAKALEPLKEIPTVERLELLVDEMEPQSLEPLRGLRQLESFEWKGSFNEACLLALPRMESIKRLELVPVDYSKLGAGLQTLERLPNLSELKFTPGDVMGKDVLRHAKLSPTPLALTIGIDPRLGSAKSSFDLSDMSAWSSVYYLQLSQIRLTGPIDFTSMPNLQTVHLDTVPLSAVDFEQLARLPKLEHLTLRRTDVTDDQLAQLLQIPTLQGVVVDEKEVTGEAFAALASSKHLESLLVPRSVVNATFLDGLRKAPAAKTCVLVPDGTECHAAPSSIDPVLAGISDALQRK
jgi:hypothetical protein